MEGDHHEAKGVFILAIEADSFLSIYSWSNNAAQDNRSLLSCLSFKACFNISLALIVIHPHL